MTRIREISISKPDNRLNVTIHRGSMKPLQDKVISLDNVPQIVEADEPYAGIRRLTIDGLGTLQEKTVTPTSEQEVVTADGEYIGLSKVTVEATPLQEKTVAPTDSIQEVTPDAGFVGLGKVTVKPFLTTSEAYAIGRWPAFWHDSPTAVNTEGQMSLALDWHLALFDMTPVETEVKKKPVGYFKRNNLFRFTDGSFAPAVAITEAMRAECDVALYLNDDGTGQYCEAGQFDAEAFYNQHGMNTPLYDVNGNSVRILRPWETTKTCYSVGLMRKDEPYLLDHEEGRDGTQLCGIVADEGMVDGIKPTHKLVPTAINIDSCTEIDGKLRCFFFAYPTGEVGCNGLSPNHGLTGTGELFFADGTYPRVLDNDLEGANNVYPNDDGKGVNQAKNAKKARACNFDPTKPYPVAEGGWHTVNTFITCLEVAYGTRNLYAPGKFSSGTSSNDAISNSEANWLNYGGMRFKASTASAWSYALWSTSNAAIRYDASNHTEAISLLINRYAPKWWCLEAQIALSMAAELNIPQNTEFECYGKTYMYKDVAGATNLLNGRMNAQVFRTRTMTLNAYNSSGAAVTYDVQCRLRAPIAEGFNLCGDIYQYIGGGHEVVQNVATGFVQSYIECDQTKWVDINHTVSQTTDYDFMETYERLQDAKMGAANYYMLRLPYGTWKLANGSGITKGECGYHYEQSLGSGANARYRAGVRFRGYAYYAYCSSRYVSSNHLASYCHAAFGCSAQVLVDVGDEMQ